MNRNAMPFPGNELFLPKIRQTEVSRLLSLPGYSSEARHTLLMHILDALKQDRALHKASGTLSPAADDVLLRTTLTVAREINAVRAKDSRLADLATQPDRYMSALKGALITLRNSQASDREMAASPFAGRLTQGIAHAIRTLKDQTLTSVVTTRPEAKPPPQTTLFSRFLKSAAAVLLAAHVLPASTPEAPPPNLIQSAPAAPRISAPAPVVQAQLRKLDTAVLTRLPHTEVKAKPVARIQARAQTIASTLVHTIKAETVLHQGDLLKVGVAMLESLPIKQAFAKAVTVESGGRQFDADGNVLTSLKGAIGRSQMLPSTARLIAPQCTGKPLDENRFVNDKGYNSGLGECYFNKRASEYGGSKVLAAIAYNYGAGNLNKHIAKVGDPTKGEIDMVKFIQAIPNREARNYVPAIVAKGNLLPKEPTIEQPVKDKEQPSIGHAFVHAGAASSAEAAASAVETPQGHTETNPVAAPAVTLE